MIHHYAVCCLCFLFSFLISWFNFTLNLIRRKHRHSDIEIARINNQVHGRVVVLPPSKYDRYILLITLTFLSSFLQSFVGHEGCEQPIFNMGAKPLPL